MSTSENQWQQLMALRDMTERTGAIHEAQILQLKYLPRVMCEVDLKPTKMAIDPEEQSIVYYTLEPLTTNVSLLTESVQKLLGDKWTVGLKRGKK